MNKRLIEKVLKKQNLTKMQAAMKSGIPPSDFYQALNGKKPFFPKWRNALAKTLNMDEELLFPQDQEKEVK